MEAFSAGSHLAFIAQQLDDIEAQRTATENRLRALTRTDPDKDGELRGLGLTEDDPSVKILNDWLTALDTIEGQTIKMLEKLMRAHPLGPFVKGLKGVGDKQSARLLAAIGDPYVRPELVLEDGAVEPSRPRMVSELISYAGWKPGEAGGRAPHRRKGENVRWNPDARKRTWLVIASCIKQTAGKKAGTCVENEDGRLVHEAACACSVYRVIYDEGRQRYAGSVHVEACPQCHAKIGDPLRDGHLHARAIRLAARQLIKDLWSESRRLHDTETSE